MSSTPGVAAGLEKFVNAGQVKDISGNYRSLHNTCPAALFTCGIQMARIMAPPLAMDIVPVWYNKEMFEEVRTGGRKRMTSC